MAHHSVRPRGTRVPDGYRLDSTTDLRANQRAATAIALLFGSTVAAMVVAALVLDLPVVSSWSTGTGVAITVAACVATMVVHELTHAVLLRWLTGDRPTVAVRLPYLTTGSEAFLTRGQAVVVALAPLVVLTPVLLGLFRALPPDFFLTVYVVLALNVAGSAGDALQAQAFVTLPRAALVRDDGERTSVYLPVA